MNGTRFSTRNYPISCVFFLDGRIIVFLFFIFLSFSANDEFHFERHRETSEPQRDNETLSSTEFLFRKFSFNFILFRSRSRMNASHLHDSYPTRPTQHEIRSPGNGDRISESRHFHKLLQWPCNGALPKRRLLCATRRLIQTQMTNDGRRHNRVVKLSQLAFRCVWKVCLENTINVNPPNMNRELGVEIGTDGVRFESDLKN